MTSLMADLVGGALAWTGGAVAILTLLDLALNARQKEWIRNLFIALFVWLDNQRELKYLRYLGRFKWLKIVIILYALLLLAVTLLVSLMLYNVTLPEADLRLLYRLLTSYVASFFTALLLVAFVLPSALNWITHTEGGWRYIVRATLVLMPVLLVGYFVNYVAEQVALGDVLGLDSEDSPESVKKRLTASPLWYWAITSIGATVLVLMTLCWVLIVIPVLLVLVLILIFRSLQFVAVRIEENPKGPILAMSAALAAIGGIVRFFAR